MTAMPPLIYRLARPVLANLWLAKRGLTMGVRGAAIDRENRVILIRHTYTPGWHLPGGGVEVGETAAEALARELREEANVRITGDAVLHGLFHQPQFSRRDHVAVFVVRDFEWPGPPKPNREIAECGLFPLTALPAETGAGTRRRLSEIANGAGPAPAW
jgi:8-oxo-dGTP pyrophosphatase MutT (NUDIX family)